MMWIKKILKLKRTPKKIVWWSGGDAIKKVIMPPGSLLFKLRVLNNRLVWVIAHRFYNEHWVNCERLGKALIKFGVPASKIKVREWPWVCPKVKRQDHNEFTILFYLPGDRTDKEYTNWIYGWEYFLQLQAIPNVRWEVVRGSSNMAEVYSTIDLYIKINATEYNDINRIGKECRQIGIDVLILDVWENFNLEDVSQWINTKRDIWLINKKRKSS